LSELGKLLRKAREERGYSLDDVQDITKIRKRYLEAIEEGDYKVLPGTFYARAFVKNYAETVGLDAEEVCRLFERELPEPEADAAVEQPVVKPRRASVRSSDRWSKWGFRVLMWSFLLLIAAVIYTYVVNQQDGSDKKTADNETPITDNIDAGTDETEDAADSTGGQETDVTGANGEAGSDTPVIPDEPDVQQTTLTFLEKSGSVERYAVAPGDTHRYEVEVADGKRSWVEIRTGDRNGEKIHYKEEKGPSVVTYELSGPVFLNIGSTRSVEIRIDGVVLPDGDDNVRRFLIVPETEGAAGIPGA
jgi:cytoskeletal protein RodZ